MQASKHPRCAALTSKVADSRHRRVNEPSDSGCEQRLAASAARVSRNDRKSPETKRFRRPWWGGQIEMAKRFGTLLRCSKYSFSKVILVSYRVEDAFGANACTDLRSIPATMSGCERRREAKPAPARQKNPVGYPVDTSDTRRGVKTPSPSEKRRLRHQITSPSGVIPPWHVDCTEWVFPADRDCTTRPETLGFVERRGRL